MKFKYILSCVLVLLLLTAGRGFCSFQIQLSAEERAWLENNPTIRLSGPQAFPPFQFVDKDGGFKGMASDYVYHIAEMVGLNVEVAENAPWSEILHKIRAKEIDVLSCAAVAAERMGYLSFSESHLSFPLVIITRKNAPFVSDVKSLTRKKIALVQKTITFDWIKSEGIEFEPLFVASPLQTLEEVSMHHADAAIHNLAAASYLIEKHGLANLKVAAPTSYDNYALSIAVRKDWPELVSIFNKGLAAMSQEKHDEIRQRWISVRYEHGLRAKDIILWVVSVSFSAIFLLSLFYLWNRKLKREIEERKKAEGEKQKLIEELTQALDEIKTLRGILPICSHCKKIRDDQGYWTRIEAYIGKHSEADFSHGICPECLEKVYKEENWFRDGDAA